MVAATAGLTLILLDGSLLHAFLILQSNSLSTVDNLFSSLKRPHHFFLPKEVFVNGCIVVSACVTN